MKRLLSTLKRLWSIQPKDVAAGVIAGGALWFVLLLREFS